MDLDTPKGLMGIAVKQLIEAANDVIILADRYPDIAAYHVMNMRGLSGRLKKQADKIEKHLDEREG